MILNIGEYLGDLLLVSKDRKIINNSCITFNKFECKCGNEVIIRQAHLHKRVRYMCENCYDISRRNVLLYKNIPFKFFDHFKRIAKCRNLKFSVDIEYINNLWINQHGKCSLTGLDLSFGNINKKFGKTSCTASLDRIDSDQGYIIGNIQILHKEINMLKLNFNQKYFIKMCKDVYKNTKTK